MTTTQQENSAAAGSGKKGFFQINQSYEEENPSALMGLFFYSALMFTLPLVGFFLTKEILESEFQVDPPWNLWIPVIVAVFIVNMVIVLYVYKAFKEDKKENLSRRKTQ